MVLGQGERLVSGEGKKFFRFPLFLCCLSLQHSKFLMHRQNIVWASKLIPQLSFFVNLIFFNFFVFLKTSNINVDSMRKINDFKINALKVERVPNVFENLNSFETMLKMLKTMQMY
jgi:hypothetical protein